MNWYGTTGSGTQTAAGTRASNLESMCGNAVMYDAVAGKILTLGGSPSYQDSTATSNVHLITMSTPNSIPTVQTLTSMRNARAFANAVILPNGKVFVTGGQTYAVPFSDAHRDPHPRALGSRYSDIHHSPSPHSTACVSFSCAPNDGRPRLHWRRRALRGFQH